MILDVAFILILVVALVVGYQKGVIQPLMSQVFFFGALFLLYRERDPYLAVLQKYIHANIVLAIFFALMLAVIAGYFGNAVGLALHRMPIARGIDGFLGVFVNVAIALAAIYFILGGLITLDKAFGPVTSTAKLTSAQVTAFSKLLNSNPLATALVDPKDLKKLQAEAKAGQTTSLDTVSQLDQLSKAYTEFVKPQLRTSRVAPYIMRFGQRLPVIGHFGPKDLPK